MRRTLALCLCLAAALCAERGWGDQGPGRTQPAAGGRAPPGVSGATITGVPGAPDATMAIDGRQLPAPPPKFGGVIRRNADQSRPYWPPRIVPPKGAPTCC